MYTKVMILSNKNMFKIEAILKQEGYGKHAKSVAMKMIKYSRGMNEFSKVTGKLKKSAKRKIIT